MTLETERLKIYVASQDEVLCVEAEAEPDNYSHYESARDGRTSDSLG